MATPDITLYTTPGCGACAAVKRYLDTKGLTYTEKDVSRNEASLIAPVTVIGDSAFYGTSGRQRPPLEAALAARQKGTR